MNSLFIDLNFMNAINQLQAKQTERDNLRRLLDEHIRSSMKFVHLGNVALHQYQHTLINQRLDRCEREIGAIEANYSQEVKNWRRSRLCAIEPVKTISMEMEII
jgi:hypothetical protein